MLSCSVNTSRPLPVFSGIFSPGKFTLRGGLASALSATALMTAGGLAASPVKANQQIRIPCPDVQSLVAQAFTFKYHVLKDVPSQAPELEMGAQTDYIPRFQDFRPAGEDQYFSNLKRIVEADIAEHLRCRPDLLQKLASL